MQKPHPLRALSIILVIFAALSLLYNWATPLFENSDELFHYPLIRHLAQNGLSLPVQSGDAIQDWHQEGSQPPLYHLIAAILISPLDHSDYDQVRRVNPHARIGIVSESNINSVIHPLDRSREFEGGTAWGVRIVRLLSMVLASVVVVATYFLTAFTFPNLPRWVGLLAAGLVAFNPMYLFVSASINNDNLSNALISTILILLVWMIRRENLPPVKIMLVIGVLLGLSLLSKLSTGPFMLIVGLFWMALAIKHRAIPYMVKWGVVTLGIALLISGWWYVRNYDLYGDPTGLNVFLDIAGRRSVDLTAEQLWSERTGFMQSFWGLYGGLTVPMSGWVYSIFNLLCGVSLIGLAHYAWIRRKEIDLPQIVLVLWAILSFVFLVRWTSMTWASQGRLWFVAIAPLGALSAAGFYHLSGWAWSKWLAGIPLAFALGIAFAAPFAWIRPAYAVPEFFVMADADPLMTFTDPDHPDESISLINVAYPAEVKTGDEKSVQLTFCSESRLSRNWSVFVHLVNEWDIILAQADFTPGHGALPTAEMAAGLCWRDEYPIKIEAGVAAQDTPLNVLVGLYEARSGRRMVLADDPMQDRYLALSTQLRVGDELQKFALGNAVRLNGYQISETVVEAGDTLTVTLDWEVLKELGADYTVFVQIINPQTTYRAGASDKMPDGGTAVWRAGDHISDVHTITLEKDAPAGVYAVLVGFYQQTEDGSFERLRVSYSGVDTGFDALTLTQVRVE
jgi:4-amino-4-deoxy-L-arabinose transferase-like glycosyltransferase